MTGRDLIIYILENRIEDRKVEAILDFAFVTPEKMAIKLGVGVETVKAWYRLGLLKGFELDDKLYLTCTSTDPRLKG